MSNEHPTFTILPHPTPGETYPSYIARIGHEDSHQTRTTIANYFADTTHGFDAWYPIETSDWIQRGTKPSHFFLTYAA